MDIGILFFGITADISGLSTTNLDIEEGVDIKALREILHQKYPNLSNYKNFSVAVNMEYATDDVILKNGDTVALIPPVSGG